jgi:hypothetical protein
MRTTERTDTQTDRHDEAKVALRNFVNSPKNEIKLNTTIITYVLITAPHSSA